MKDGWQPGPEAGTILGIEVLLPNSMGRIWLEGAEGLHLLYGRNGAGKSTVLNALRNFFMGQSTSETVRCFMRLPDDVLDGPIGMMDVDQDATDLLTTILESDQSPLMSDESDQPSLGSDIESALSMFHELENMAKHLLEFQQMLDEGEEPGWITAGYDTWPGEREYRYVEEHPLTQEMRVGLQEVVAHMDRNSAWRHALAEPWARAYCEYSGFDREDEIRPCLRSVGIERSDEWIQDFLSRDPNSWYDNVLEHGWEEFILLTLISVLAFDWVLGELPYTEELFEGQGDGGLPAAAIREVATSRLVCLTSGTRGWSVSPAAKLSEDTPNLTRLWSETKEAFRTVLLRINPHASASDRELAATYRLMRRYLDDQPNFVHQDLPSALLAGTTQLDFLFTESGPSDHPYVSANTVFSSGVLESPLPGWPVVVDLDDPIDPDSWLTDRFAALLGSGSKPPTVRDAFLTEVVAHLAESDEEPWAERARLDFEQRMRPADVRPSSSSDSTSLLWSGPESTALESDAEFPEFEAFRDRVAAFGDLLPRLGIGIGGLRVEPNWWLPDWIDGKPVRLEALDQPSDAWVEVSDLSDAQRRWAAIVIQVGEAQEEALKPWFARAHAPSVVNLAYGFPVVPFRPSIRTGPAARVGSIAVFGDEIDAGVHVAASKAIFRTLAEIPGIGFVSSHSPTALRTPLVRLVNVHRNDTGRIAITSPGLSDDVQEAALRLGIDFTDVLASMYLAVIVEGSHDAIVIEELLRGEDNTDRMLVIEGRGAHSMTSIADARLLLDFCDLRLLIVLDNVANDRYQPILESLKNLCDQGVAVNKAIKESGLERLQMDSTPEERTLNEILERGARRGVLDRIDIHGLPVRDIVELLPPSSFGLEHDWSHYGKEFRSTRGTSNFKTFMRDKHQVSISKKTIRKAVAGLDQMTDGLIALQEALLVAAEMASRDRGLSVTE